MLNSLKTYFRLLAEDREMGLSSKILRPTAYAASFVYGSFVRTLRIFYEKGILRRKRLPFPVISVGNLTWGGTGKTPLVEYLARKVSELHKTPLILTRGYSHDEIEQLRHYLPRAIIGVGKNRRRVAEEHIRKKERIDVGILDDGFQHWPIERDIEIVAVNVLNPFGNGHLIPRGILREPVSTLRKASIIVLTHVNLVKPEEIKSLKEKIAGINPNAFLVESYLEPLFLYRADRRKRVSIGRLQHHRVATFAGVGTPRSFQLLLSRCQIRPTRNFEFADHHVYKDSELEEIKRISHSASVDEIITTEKDFYRSPDAITRILNPLVLATRLRILSGEEILTDRLFLLMGVKRL